MTSITDKTGATKSLTDEDVESSVLVDDTWYTVDDLRCTVDGVILDQGQDQTDKDGATTSFIDKSSYDVEGYEFFNTSAGEYFQTSESKYLLVKE
jgi:hypothetical protein